jgi:hypothetical protein
MRRTAGDLRSRASSVTGSIAPPLPRAAFAISLLSAAGFGRAARKSHSAMNRARTEREQFQNTR